MRPAWRGIVGWVLFVAACVVAATTPWPWNGQALAALLLGVVGIGLVVLQVLRTEARRPWVGEDPRPEPASPARYYR